MANEEHLKILDQGIEVWNKWRDENQDVIPDLSEADLSRRILIGRKLDFVDLSRANLSEANILGTDLEKSSFEAATLTRAVLIASNLSRTNLSRADLRGAQLSFANLSSANLTGAYLAFLNIGATIFADVDLSEVKGLDSVNHIGPSSIGIDTIYKSQGKIPEVFLRGAGVPEEFIEYMRSLVSGKAIQFYSCFISYSTKDQEFAKRLHADLQSEGVRVWFAPEDIKGGRKLHEQIPEAIRLYDKLLLVISDNSMNSEWVKTEIYHAIQDEKQEKRRKLFPIGLVDFGKIRDWTAFNADAGKDMAREIREYFIPDFSNWKDHDAYKRAFDRLLKDLNLDAKE